MLYLDYARKAGERIPNRFGGRENLEATEFLRDLNKAVYREHPGATMIAEESTAWPMVSRPTDMGGLGFGMKWNMGWMHDTLAYFSQDPIYRRYHHGQLTFSLIYAFNENSCCRSRTTRWCTAKERSSARCRATTGKSLPTFALCSATCGAIPARSCYSWATSSPSAASGPTRANWNGGCPRSTEHAGVQRLVRDLNAVYRAEPALHRLDFSQEGFEWLDVDNADASVLAFLRKAGDSPPVLVVCNLTPVPRHNYLVGVPKRGLWREVLNSDAQEYGGAGWGNMGGVESVPGDHPRARRVLESDTAAAVHSDAAVGIAWLRETSRAGAQPAAAASTDPAKPRADGRRARGHRCAVAAGRRRPLSREADRRRAGMRRGDLPHRRPRPAARRAGLAGDRTETLADRRTRSRCSRRETTYGRPSSRRRRRGVIAAR